MEDKINGLNSIINDNQSFYKLSIFDSEKSTNSNISLNSNSSQVFTFKKTINMNNKSSSSNKRQSINNEIYSLNEFDIAETGHFGNNIKKEENKKYKDIIKKNNIRINLFNINDKIFTKLAPEYQRFDKKAKIIYIKRHLMNIKFGNNLQSIVINDNNKNKERIVDNKKRNMSTIEEKKTNINFNNNLIFRKINNRSLLGKYLKTVGLNNDFNEIESIKTIKAIKTYTISRDKRINKIINSRNKGNNLKYNCKYQMKLNTKNVNTII